MSGIKKNIKNSIRGISGNKGFTLVELLVVISIIALLLAILIPSLSKAKEVTNRIICAHILKNIGMANVTYTNVYGGVYCPIYFLDPNDDVKGPPGVCINARWHDVREWPANRGFRDILKVDMYPKDKLNAPLPYQTEEFGRYNGPYNWPKALLCPSDKVSRDWTNNFVGVLISYGYNTTGLAGPYMGYKVSDIKLPSTKLAFIDSIDWYVSWSARSADYQYAWDRYGQSNIRDYRSGSNKSFSYQPVMYRHNEGANCGFYDGHVKYMKKQKIFVRDDYYRKGTDTPREDKKPGMWSGRY